MRPIINEKLMKFWIYWVKNLKNVDIENGRSMLDSDDAKVALDVLSVKFIDYDKRGENYESF